MAKANVILLNSILWNLREITKLADVIKEYCGDVECTSWRYPLITCGELEIFKLLQNNRSLDNYTYILELTYDRLLYVLNLIVKYMESHESLENFRPERNVKRPKTLSLASVLCMIWERIRAQMEGENFTGPATAAVAVPAGDVKAKVKDSFDAEIEIKISKSTTCTQSEVCSISVCSCCEMVQEFVTQLVLEMEKILQKLDCDSAITIERRAMKETLVEMTNWSAMSKWLEAIVKDFNTIIERTEQENACSRKLRNRIDMDERKVKMKVEQYEDEIRHLENRFREQELKMATVKEEKDRVIRERNQLREEMAVKKTMIMGLTAEHEEKLCELRKSYEAKLTKQKEKKTRRDMERDKEWKLKFDTECKRRQVIESETQRLAEALTKAAEEAAAAREEKNNAEALCRALGNDLENVRNENADLKSILNQKQDVIDDYSRRILEAFPQLSDSPKATYRASGNPEIDMANQIEANNIRVEMLQAENDKLQKALIKIKALKG